VRFEKETTGCTALHLACQEGFDEACSVLLAHGADANTVRLSDGALFDSSSNALGSALSVAYAGGEAECAATLLGHGATVDLETSDDMAGLLFASQMVAIPPWYWRPWAGTWTACKDCCARCIDQRCPNCQ